MKLYVSAVMASLIVSSATVSAADKGDRYGSILLSRLSTDIANQHSASNTAINVKFGQFLTNYFSFEGRLLWGANEDEFNKTITWSVDSNIGAYLVGHLPVSNQLTIQGIAGLSRTDMTIDNPYQGKVYEHSNTDFSYGIGISYRVNEKIETNLEYMSYYTDKFDDGSTEGDFDIDVSSISLGASFRF